MELHIVSDPHPATGGSIPYAPVPSHAERDTLHVGSRMGIPHIGDPLDPYEHAHALGDAAVSPEPPAHPDLITEIAEIPHSVWAMERQVKALLDLLAEAFTPRPLAPLATLSNTSGTQIGSTSTAYAVAVPVTLTQQGALELQNVVVGTDAAQAVELRAASGDASGYTSGYPNRLLGTLRTTASGLSAQFNTPILLQPGESLVLVCISASSVKFDFSCRYRYMRS